ncbi:MAG: DUF4292 domain-containing protein [Bacteroides sp.]|jgi:hypothetical protein|nr:DUF4292 domain-containing protein [Bacteroides sp.]
MNKRLIPKLLILVLLLAGIHGCKPRRDIIPVADDLLRSPERALRTLHANQADFEFYSARFSGDALWEGKNYSVSGSLRIQKDQAIFLSVAPFLGIELARVLITPDTVKYINRMQSNYFIGDMRFINKMLGTDLDFYMLQAILTGNDFEHFSADNFNVTDDRSMIYLHSSGRRRINERDAPRIEHGIWMEPVNYRVRKSIVIDPETQRSIEADYNHYENMEGQWLPNDLAISFIEPKGQSKLSIRLNRTTLNQPQEFSFSIPSRYTPVDF